jgi:hypothetical protein
MVTNNKLKMSIFVFFLLTGMACNLLSSGGAEAPENVDSGGVLFQDDFSDTNSGWDQYREADFVTDYENGGYRFFVNQDYYDIWANPGLNFTDTVIEVKATKIGGPDENDFGVICRYQDENNFYMLIIASDGYYGIGAVEGGGDMELIGSEYLEISEQINQGSATNEIRAECVGDNLTLYANGTILADVRDSRFSSGDVGLIAGTFETPGAEILFDDFVVRKP